MFFILFLMMYAYGVMALASYDILTQNELGLNLFISFTLILCYVGRKIYLADKSAGEKDWQSVISLVSYTYTKHQQEQVGFRKWWVAWLMLIIPCSFLDSTLF